MMDEELSGEFTVCPALDDLLIRTEGIGRAITGQNDIGTQNGTPPDQGGADVVILSNRRRSTFLSV
jgi:hypothetical protein